ncbi:UbiA family prenyltransferase [bacterium SCSIO 12741]|nr:UbiA family prenyltransferase [bacterium SCSIO 12741]
MISKTVTEESSKITLKMRLADLALLTKMRLSMLVVISAILGYLVAAPSVSLYKLSILIVGGFLVTGASNAFNQIWERDADRLMNRTSKRPLVTGRMSIREALIYSTLFGLGVFCCSGLD